MSIRKLIRNKWFGFAVKAGISTAVLFFSVRHLGLLAIGEKLWALGGWPIVLSVSICLVQNYLSALRWHWIIEYLGESFSLWRAFCIVEMYSFVGQALPATVGGDAVRVVQTWQSGVSMPRAITSVLVDRSFGLGGIAVVGLIGLPFVSHRLGHFESTFLLAGVLCLVGGVSAIGLRRYWLAWLPTKLAIPVGTFLGFAVGLSIRPQAWLWTLLPSMVIQVLSTLIVYVALRHFGITIGFIECTLSVTLGLLIALLPISLGGWGVREGALIYALGALGVPPAEALASSLLLGFAQFSAALPGGLLLLFFKPSTDASGRWVKNG